MSLRVLSHAGGHRAGVVLTGAVFASVLTAAAFGPQGPVAEAAASKIRALDPAAVFPDSTLMLLQFDGRPCLKHAKELGISRILRSPEMNEFAGSLIQQASGGAQAGLEAASSMAGFDVPGLVDLIMTGRTMVGLTRVETEVVDKGDFQTKQTSVDLMLALNFAQGRQESMRGILDAVAQKIEEESSGPPAKKVTIGGIDAQKFALQEGEKFRPFSSLTYLLVDDWMLIGTNDAQLEQSVLRIKSGDAAGSLAAYPIYKKCAAETLRPKSVFGMYVGMKDGLARVEKLEHGPEIIKQLKGSGIEQMTAFALASELDGLAMRDRLYIHGYNPSGLVAKPELDKVHAMMPKSSSMAFSTAFDLRKFLDLMLAAFASELGDKPAKAIAAFEAEHKVNVREDLLAALGPEMGMYATLPRYGLIPDVGFLIRTPDPAKAKAAIKKLLAIAKLDLNLGTTTHRGTDINYVEIDSRHLEVDGERLHPHPCYAFVDGYLLVAPWPQAAKNFLDAAARKDGGFAAREDVAAAFARLRTDTPTAGMGGMSYFDLPAMAGFVLDVAIPVAQSTIAPSRISELAHGFVELDFAKFPSTELFTSNLSPLLMTTQYDSEGMSSHIVSPVGLSTMYAFGVAGIAGYFATQAEARYTGESKVLKVEPEKAEPAKDGEEDKEDK
jgi:hypothetical protein